MGERCVPSGDEEAICAQTEPTSTEKGHPRTPAEPSRCMRDAREDRKECLGTVARPLGVPILKGP